uniref:Uncharacterized protein n=1 Tax=Arundo donax TaxID=35708 RepID=A0A0A9ACP9_ARUDO
MLPETTDPVFLYYDSTIYAEYFADFLM